jgi:hypothetical protein
MWLLALNQLIPCLYMRELTRMEWKIKEACAALVFAHPLYRLLE